ncbi:aminopeptidase N [Paeniglutamicibacter sulfureus]|uniref:Aminopeptidase N n=1 Tax=Paeniglutamicibacter sulfureus TaxID=43666 RepID=A0ABU2BDV4_9MICC|nr:aminopeptidase N [Paeniglutamicibacter sulfureus]MDO2936575.1 aminopeptidase N [Paeniglutamicibacter sulfureus]MDR7356775.1 aminopeptidase N [Paeniglutamicibacter sulfureus]
MPGMNLTREEARTRAALITVHSYDVELDLTGSDTVYSSRTTVRFSAVEGAESFIDAVTDAVRSVNLNGTELDPAEVSDGVRIALPGLAAENTLVIDADALYMNTGEGLHRFVDPVDDEVYLYSQFEVPDSRRMFAVFEQPDLKATFAFTITAPAHWDVISNAATPVPVDAHDGAKTWAFAPTARISSYITALIAGPYQCVRSELTSSDGRMIPLGVFARASLMEHLDAENIFTLTRQGFEFFEKQFGTPYPFEKYDQLFVPEFNAGAMENAGAVTFLESYVFRSRPTDAMVERRAITVLHELAHMWFGDLVTMRWWNDLWLNESFAEFMSTLAAAQNTEFTSSWTTFNILEKNWAYRQDQLPSTHPIVAEIRDLEDVQVNFDGITYAKGASVLRQLVAWVGQEEFMAGVRSYFAKHAWSNTELPDLMRELEASSGRDLSEWSKLWLETAGVNTLRAVISTDDAGLITDFSITQTAVAEHPVIRPHRLAVGFYDLDAAGSLIRVHREELDVAGPTTAVPALVGRKRPALVLVNDDDLAYAKIRLDGQSLATATAHLKDFEQSLPRTLVWGAAWDAVRDAETPARAYLELVLGNIGHETDSTVIMVLLRQLNTALDYYVDRMGAPAARLAAADRLWELARAAEAGSDAQLQFVGAFAHLAHTGPQLDAVAALLSGELVLEGLEVDAEMRWDLLTSLSAGGLADAGAIAAELERDATSTGQLSAHTARAAMPTPEAKRAAWDAVIGGKLSNLEQRAAITGFNHVHDPALIAGYVEEYFDVAGTVWETKSYEIAQQIVTGLYPAAQTTPETLAKTDAFLHSLGEDSPALRRLVIESRDAVVRALAAQAADA